MDQISFKVGDKVSCVYGEGEIIRLDPKMKIHTVSMTTYTGKGYPATLLGIHESGLTLVDDSFKIYILESINHSREIVLDRDWLKPGDRFQFKGETYEIITLPVPIDTNNIGWHYWVNRFITSYAGEYITKQL